MSKVKYHFNGGIDLQLKCKWKHESLDLSFLIVLSFHFCLFFYGSVLNFSQRLIAMCQYPAGWLPLESWWGASMCRICCQHFCKSITRGQGRWRWNHFLFFPIQNSFTKTWQALCFCLFWMSKFCPQWGQGFIFIFSCSSWTYRGSRETPTPFRKTLRLISQEQIQQQ